MRYIKDSTLLMTMTLMLINRTIITIAVQAPPIRILEYKSLTLSYKEMHATKSIYCDIIIIIIII